MKKVVAIIIAVIGVFLFFTYDVGFDFERADPQERVDFVERQSGRAAMFSGFHVRSGPDAVFVSADQRLVRLKARASGAPKSGAQRSQTFTRGCQGYLRSQLAKHAITLRVEFFRDNGMMDGTISLSPSMCPAAAARVS